VTCGCHVEVAPPVAVVRHRHDCANGEGVERRPIRATDLLATEVSCPGYRRRHHRTDGELIRTAGRPNLCRTCWLRWRSEVDR
jgi:hypothetical protein